jgi:iron complex transport system ATP-binding protein
VIAGIDTRALRADGVGYRIGQLSILDGVSLDLRPGELLGLVGPNGSGKTTLLRALTGLIAADGEVSLEGRDLARLDERAVARTAARVPQSTAYDGGFSTEELVLTGRSPHLGRFQWETPHDRAIAERAMRETRTQALAERLVAELSGGERQRVFVARALAQQTPILLLDEPTANLDIGHQVRVLGLVRRLTDQGLATIAAIHDLELAARFADRLLLLRAGRVLAEGRPADVLTAENLCRAYGVRALVEPDPRVAGVRITVLDANPSDACEANAV